MNPEVTAFFDEATNTVSYVVTDPSTQQCAVIDSVLDFDPASGRTATDAVDKLLEFIRDNRLEVQWIIDTHVHADHLSAAQIVRSALGGVTAIGEKVAGVQRVFGDIFNEGDGFADDGSQFEHLFADGERYRVGSIEATALHTSGHTPACMSHLIGDALFVGDTLFMPDYGSARCDFPGGDAATLYRSVQRLYALPAETRMFLCHDYKAEGRDYFAWETTVGEQKKSNVHIRDGVSEAEFVAMRTKRDATLSMPRLILPSVQVNIRAGTLPAAEDNGVHYLKLPVNAF